MLKTITVHILMPLRWITAILYHITYTGSVFSPFSSEGLPDKPILITECTIDGRDRGMLGSVSNPGPMTKAKTEALSQQTKRALAYPQIVGVHHFRFHDQSLIGRWADGNYNLGLMDICDTPYHDLLEKNRTISKNLYENRVFE